MPIDKCIYSRFPVSTQNNLSHVHVDTESRYATAIETFINMMLNSRIPMYVFEGRILSFSMNSETEDCYSLLTSDGPKYSAFVFDSKYIFPLF